VLIHFPLALSRLYEIPSHNDDGPYQGTARSHDIQPLVQMFGYSCLTQEDRRGLPVPAVMQTLYSLTGETKWRYTLKSRVDIVTQFNILHHVECYGETKIRVYFGSVMFLHYDTASLTHLFNSSVWFRYLSVVK